MYKPFFSINHVIIQQPNYSLQDDDIQVWYKNHPKWLSLTGNVNIRAETNNYFINEIFYYLSLFIINLI